MKIAARVSNGWFGHSVEVETEGQSIAIAPKSVGRGSSINDAELWFAALATCVCNDLSLSRSGEAQYRYSGCQNGSDGNIWESRRDSPRTSATASKYMPIHQRPRLTISFERQILSLRFKTRVRTGCVVRLE